MANYANYYNNFNQDDNFGSPVLDDPPSYQHVIDNYPNGQPSSLGYSNVVVGGVESYGRALFPFKAEFPNELSLKENEIVHLIRHINNDWTEGEIDGKIGIFPRNFIEIIVDCDQNNGNTEDSNQNNSISVDFPPDSFGRVLFDFDAQVEGDLTIRKGDTLTLIRKMDQWFEVMDDSGNFGLVPGNFIEVIEETSANVSATPSNIEDAINSTNQNTDNIISGNNYYNYPNLTEISQDSKQSDASLIETKPEVVKEFDPMSFQSTNQNIGYLNNGSKSNLRPHPDPQLPKSPTSQTKPVQQVSPHRPPPPVPKHKTNKNLQRSSESIDSINLNRLDPTRSSIASNSSSGSAKSDSASGVTVPVPSADDQRRVDERKKKVREQRGCVIMELLQTERDYRSSLAVCADIFLKKPEEAKNVGIDLDKLFGNLEEVIEVSSRLILLLEESTCMKIYEQQRVGKCFLEIADQMKKAYSTYCRNHDETQPLWNQYERQPETIQYLRQGLEQMRELTNCFDIPSVLIKPVQRILKYPLLLNELHKCTEDGHEDKPDLILAIDLITNMATNINESKRRQDLVHKYREERCHGLSHRLSKFTLHTVVKKGTRFGHRITSTLGLSNSTKDDEFDLIVQRFRTVEKTIKIFAKDKQAFMKSAHDFSNQGLAVVEAIGQYYDKKNRQQEVEQLRTTHRVIVTQYWNEFNATVDRDVTPVLDKLINKFSGPNQLIKKRQDKLTDYDSVSRKIECNKDMTRQRGLQEQQTLAKNVYEALNTQLLEELPKLCDISMQILQDCIQAFLLARKRLIGRIAKHHLSLLELPLVLGFTAGSVQDIGETFHIKHNLICEQILDELSILPPNVFPNASQTDLNRKQSSRSSRRSMQLTNVNISVANTRDVNKNTNKNVPQSASQRAYLQSRYQKYQLYEALEPYEAVDVYDICLKKGDLVGVIKQQDPMGSKHRWYVDAGTAQGFVLASILIPHHGDAWAAPPDWQSSVGQANGQSQSEKISMMMNENTFSSLNSSPVPNSKTDSKSSTPTQPSVPLVQHQYKVFPSPDPAVELRHEVEERRYEVVSDSPPRYSTLGLPSDLLSFDSPEKDNKETHRYSNLDEFDPLAPHEQQQTYSANSSETTVLKHRYEEIPEETPPPPTPQRTSSQSLEVYFAAYPFKAGDNNQLNLEFGQSVVVQHKCDLTGNNEWWFVTDRDGNSGYVPANYLTKHKSN